MGVGGGGPSRTCASPRRGLQLSDPQWPGGNFLGSVLQFKTHPAHPSFLPPLLSHFQTHNNFSSISLSPNKYLASLICPSVCFPEVTKLTKQSGEREVWTEMVGLSRLKIQPPSPFCEAPMSPVALGPPKAGGTLCSCALGGSKRSHTCPSSIPLPNRQAELGGRAIYPGDRHRRSTGRYPGGQMSGAAAHLTQVELWVRLQMGGWG